MRRRLELLVAAFAGAIGASIGLAAAMPDPGTSRVEFGSPVYYGGLECYRSIEPVSAS